MRVIELDIPEVKILIPDRFSDSRGCFSETYNRRTALGINAEFVQDNHSLSAKAGTVRGLHFQCPPLAQDKLVRVIGGKAFDVAVDLRRGSPNYGRHVTAVLSAELGNQIFIPKGFAHGFCTLEPDTEVVYKVSDYHAPEKERGVLWKDPDLEIDWPIADREAIVAARDQNLPCLKDLAEIFTYHAN